MIMTTEAYRALVAFLHSSLGMEDMVSVPCHLIVIRPVAV